ncbi:hypothetical protein SBV1_210010 [Verrucomicrobia bacterium]|nr:hypothetical protein SBV1_210010 [Verrucomicrobiota bacterium]
MGLASAHAAVRTNVNLPEIGAPTSPKVLDADPTAPSFDLRDGIPRLGEHRAGRFGAAITTFRHLYQFG